MNNKLNVANIILFIFIVFLIIFAVSPFLFAIVFSFSGPELATSMFLPKNFSIEAYRYILFEDPIWPFLGNSLSVAGLSCLITLPMSVMAGYGFSRTNTRWSNILFYIFLIFRMIPWITPALPVFFFLQRIGLIDTHFGLALILSLWDIPLAIWLMRGYFDMVPRELEEAARVDGANYINSFLRVVLPLALMGVLVTSFFVFLYAYIDFLYALIISRSNVITLPVKMASYSTEGRMFWRELTAAALISAIPMIALFSILQRHIASGLTFGALKE